MYKWPLNVSNFTWLDRIKICLFFLNPNNYWTQGNYVKKLEQKMASFMHYKFAVFVSSGSAANTILAMYIRDKIGTKGTRNIVVLPSTTWQTSCSPWIREGFHPHFIDVSLYDYSMDLEKLEKYLERNYKKVAVVFPTSLLGCNVNYGYLIDLQKKYKDIYFAIDECENHIGASYWITDNKITCTISTYFGHQMQTIEGGFLLTNSEDEFKQFLMYRNHGMTRGLESYYDLYEEFKNCDVDSRFDFHCLGNNFRNSNVNAYIGLLDLNRINKYADKRIELGEIFRERLDSYKYFIPGNGILFCLPIVVSYAEKDRLDCIKNWCNKNGVEVRPIISGFLGYHIPYKKYMKKNNFPNSVYLHNCGIYVGLNHKLKKRKLLKLIEFLNSLWTEKAQ